MKNLFVLCVLGAWTLAGCGYGGTLDQGTRVSEDRLRTQRFGREGECMFRAQGAYYEEYSCSLLSVMAATSASTGKATLVFSPVQNIMSVTGMIQLNGPVLRPGEYTLKDFSSAAFSVFDKGETTPSWSCQAGGGVQTLGALKLKLTSAQPTAVHGADTTYQIHGVFEVLMVHMGRHVASGDVILHGEF